MVRASLLRVGLTGGIACGKSHVLRRLKQRGCLTLDLDRVAHDVMAPGAQAYAEVVAAFGERILGASLSIDRKALGAIVFADGSARERLNRIVHPHVRDEEKRRLAALPAGAVAVTDAALLVESGLHLRFDRMVVVHCAPLEQLRRLMARDSLSRRDAEARLLAQMPLFEKRRFAHFEVDSSGSPEDTDAAAGRLAERLRALASEPATPSVVAASRLLGALLAAEEPGRSLLVELAAAGGLELPRVARLLAGREQGWLAPAGQKASVRPLDVVAPVVAWVLGRRGQDRDLLGLATMSVARAVSADTALVGEACAAGWLMARSEAVGLAALRPPELEQALAFAERWCGAPVVLDIELARAGWGALAGWLAGAEPAGCPPALVTAVDRFLAAAQQLGPFLRPA